jgi:hypothetical protein
MSWNPYKRLQQLVAGPGTDVGEVVSVETDGAIIELVSGAQIRAQGDATLGDWVYVKGGVIQGPAPPLQGTVIEV